MITDLTKTQLAFLLDISPTDARKKMIAAYCSWKKIEPKVQFEKTATGREKMSDQYPPQMEIRMLSEYMNLPTLQAMVDDIHNNYMTRNATKKYILSDYPEKEIVKMQAEGKNRKINIPVALKSLLPENTVTDIENEWLKRYPKLQNEA